MDEKLKKARKDMETNPLMILATKCADEMEQKCDSEMKTEGLVWDASFLSYTTGYQAGHAHASRNMGVLLDALDKIGAAVASDEDTLIILEWISEKVQFTLAPWEQVPCPECGGSGKAEYRNSAINSCNCDSCKTNREKSTRCPNPNCKDGKVWRERD